MTWWIATVSPSCEFRAATDVAAIGLDAWLPIRTVEIRNRRKTLPVIKRDYPLFPGYLFVHAWSSDWRDDWHAMRSARDVRGVLANCGVPCSLTDGTVDILRARLEAPVIPVVEEAYRIGESVRVTAERSPWLGFDAQVHDTTDKGTIRILLSIFGRQTPVEVLGSQLERVA